MSSGSDSSDDEFYEIERIEDYRFNRRKVLLFSNRKRRGEYFVKWKGYSRKDNSWVLEEDMNCEDLLNEFHNKKTRSSKRTFASPTKKRAFTSPVKKKPSFSPVKKKNLRKRPSFLMASPAKSSPQKDRHEKLLDLPMGDWEDDVVSVVHVSEPENNDLVVHIKL